MSRSRLSHIALFALLNEIPITLDATARPRSNAPKLDNFWKPFTANRQFKASPCMLVSTEGMYYTSADGRSVCDGTAGLWCVNAGHGRRQIVEAVERQLRTLDFAERLVAIAPADLDRIVFTGSGSDFVETALQMSLAYQLATGQGTRTRFIGRELGYHGVGFGGISVGGIVDTSGA